MEPTPTPTPAFKAMIESIPKRYRNALHEKVLVFPTTVWFGERAPERLRHWLELDGKRRAHSGAESVNTLHRRSWESPLTPAETKEIIDLSWPFVREFYRLYDYCRPYLHGGFTIRYASHEDRALPIHTDDSTYTINICLQNESSGSELVFERGATIVPVTPVTGEVIIHLGSAPHRTNPLTAGTRTNLVLWIKAHRSDTGMDVGMGAGTNAGRGAGTDAGRGAGMDAGMDAVAGGPKD